MAAVRLVFLLAVLSIMHTAWGSTIHGDEKSAAFIARVMIDQLKNGSLEQSGTMRSYVTWVYELAHDYGLNYEHVHQECLDALVREIIDTNKAIRDYKKYGLYGLSLSALCALLGYLAIDIVPIQRPGLNGLAATPPALGTTAPTHAIYSRRSEFQRLMNDYAYATFTGEYIAPGLSNSYQTHYSSRPSLSNGSAIFLLWGLGSGLYGIYQLLRLLYGSEMEYHQRCVLLRELFLQREYELMLLADRRCLQENL